jgi:hypothetical protein
MKKPARVFKSVTEVQADLAECDRLERMQNVPDPYGPEAEEAMRTWQPEASAERGSFGYQLARQLAVYAIALDYGCEPSEVLDQWRPGLGMELTSGDVDRLRSDKYDAQIQVEAHPGSEPDEYLDGIPFWDDNSRGNSHWTTLVVASTALAIAEEALDQLRVSDYWDSEIDKHEALQCAINAKLLS